MSWVLPGTSSCAVVSCGSCALPGFAAAGGFCCLAPVRVPWLGPAACLTCVARGPALVPRASSSLVALGAPLDFSDAVVPFPDPGACAPGFSGRLQGAREGRPRTGLSMPAAGRCRAFADPVTEACGFLYCPSFDEGDGRCIGTLSCGRLHRPFQVRGHHARVPRVCACACSSWPGWAGQPPGRVFGAPHPSLWPVQVRSLFARPPQGWGCPVCACCCVFSFFFFLPLCAPPLPGVPCFPARGSLGLGVLLSLPPLLPHAPPLFFFTSLSSPLRVFFSFLPAFPLFFVCRVFFPRFRPLFFFLRAVLVVRCGVGLCVCCCGRCAPAGAGLCLLCVVRCSLVVPALCVLLPGVLGMFDGAVLAAFLLTVLSLVPCLSGLSCGLVVRRLRPVVALGCCGGVPLLVRVLSCCSALRWCVLCWSLWFGVLPRCGVPCGVVHRPTAPLRAVDFFLCLLAVLPLPWLVVVPCVVRCRWSVGVVLRSVVPCLFCPVLCVVLVLGWVAPCALLSGAVSPFCCVLLSPAAVVSAGFFFFSVVPCLSVVVPAVSACVSLCLDAICCLAWPCRVAFLCLFLLRSAVWCCAVTWCVSSFSAVLFVSLRSLGRVFPRPLLWWTVVLCLSLGAVLCCPAVLPVVRVLSFLVPCF